MGCMERQHSPVVDGVGSFQNITLKSFFFRIKGYAKLKESADITSQEFYELFEFNLQPTPVLSNDNQTLNVEKLLCFALKHA